MPIVTIKPVSADTLSDLYSKLHLIALILEQFDPNNEDDFTADQCLFDSLAAVGSAIPELKLTLRRLYDAYYRIEPKYRAG